MSSNVPARERRVLVGEAFRPPDDEAPARKLNRLRLSEYIGAKAYSLTLATAARQPWLAEEAVGHYCLEALRETSARLRFDVYAYCFMPDHLHLLVGSSCDDGDLIDFVKRFKQKTGWWFKNREIAGALKASPTGSIGSQDKNAVSLWQRSYYDHIIRSEDNLRAAAEYIIANPVQAGLTKEPGEYAHAGSLVWPDIHRSR
jgi:putative transposase